MVFSIGSSLYQIPLWIFTNKNSWAIKYLCGYLLTRIHGLDVDEFLYNNDIKYYCGKGNERV
jgi:hypothetical protein